MCSHTNTTIWVPNTGNLFDESAAGQPAAIHLPSGTVRLLTLCKDCGRTFAGKKSKAPATLRELEESEK